jgi:hypothetical protein
VKSTHCSFVFISFFIAQSKAGVAVGDSWWARRYGSSRPSRSATELLERRCDSLE